MFDNLKTFFDKKTDLTEISFDSEKIAVVALLISTAKYDGNFDESERIEIHNLIKNYFSLSSESTDDLFKAAEKIENEANDLQQFTRSLNKLLNEEEKLKIIELIWKIVMADGIIDNYEENLVRRLSGLLYLQDKDIGNIKNKLTNDIHS
ncbi:MAG: TerB family tellurite resistance protein [Pelagibacterales bacterium]|nr:TerB family tellurite resistance protein [Pelagibacterales bacterium]MBL6861444.1 TerB family tellurite resistance protein [Pelagibacterales bacterium]